MSVQGLETAFNVHWETESHLKLVARGTAATARTIKNRSLNVKMPKISTYPRLDILSSQLPLWRIAREFASLQYSFHVVQDTKD
jgi:hypothetical protein